MQINFSVQSGFLLFPCTHKGRERERGAFAESTVAASSSLHLFLFFLTSLPIVLVKSDNALITQLSNKTPEPRVCSDCLKSDPSSQTADPNGLALILVKCEEQDTTFMYEGINKIYQKTPKDSRYSASQEYDGIAKFVRDKNYGSAKLIIAEDITPFVNGCLDEYKKHPPLDIPSEVLDGTSSVKEDLNVLVAVLNSL